MKAVFLFHTAHSHLFVSGPTLNLQTLNELHAQTRTHQRREIASR